MPSERPSSTPLAWAWRSRMRALLASFAVMVLTLHALPIHFLSSSASSTASSILRTSASQPTSPVAT